jgi:hypothetical protein
MTRRYDGGAVERMAEVPDFVGLLAQASREFSPEPPTELLPLIMDTVIASWAAWRLEIWVCDRGQERDRVLAEGAGLEAMAPAKLLERVFKLRPSLQLVEYLAALIVRAVWGLRLLRQVAAGDPRAAAFITGLLVPSDDKELQRNLKIDRITDWENPEDKDLQQVGETAAVERERVVRMGHNAKLMQFITDRGLVLRYPEIDAQSTKLSDRWNETELLSFLVDRIGRVVLPHSPEAGDMRRAARWAILDEFKRRDAKKRGKDAVREPLNDDVTPDPAATDPEGSASGNEIIAKARQHLGEKAARYFAAVANDLGPEDAAKVAGITARTGLRYREDMATLIRNPSGRKKKHRS